MRDIKEIGKKMKLTKFYILLCLLLMLMASCSLRQERFGAQVANSFDDFILLTDPYEKFDEFVAKNKKFTSMDLTNAGVDILNKFPKLKNQSIPFFLKAVELDPKNTMALTELGISLQLKNNYPEALMYLEKAIKLEPNNAKACEYIADIRFDMYDNNLAAEYYKKALDIKMHDQTNDMTNDKTNDKINDKSKNDRLKLLKAKLLLAQDNTKLPWDITFVKWVKPWSDWSYYKECKWNKKSSWFANSYGYMKWYAKEYY